MNQYPKYIPGAVHETLERFSDKTQALYPEALRQRAERVGKTLDMFVKGLPKRAFDAAALLPLARYIHDPEETSLSGPAAEELMEYLTSPSHGDNMSPQDIDYILALSRDVAVIDGAARSYKERIRNKKTRFGRKVLQVMTGGDDMPIPKEYWLNATIGVDVPELSQVTQEVEAESVVIGAASTLEELTHCDDIRRQFDLVNTAETFYIPATGALGLSAMAMAIGSETNKVRLRNAGREDLIKKAKEVLGPIKAVGQDRIIEALFGKPPENEKASFHVDNETPYGETIHFRNDSLAHFLGEEWEGCELKTRTKTEGSTARKMTKEPYTDKLPNDLIGLTAVVRDEAQIASLFRIIYKRVQSLSNFTPVAAASKKKPIVIEGDEAYVASLRAYIEADEAAERAQALEKGEEINEAGLGILDSTQTKMVDGEPGQIFRVMKITLIATIDGVEMPIEIQIQTIEDREVSQTGPVSHIGYKADGANSKLPENVAGRPGDLRAMRTRKEELMVGLQGGIIIKNPQNIRPFSDKLDAIAAQWFARS